MAQDLCDRDDVGAALEEGGREVVAQQVHMEGNPAELLNPVERPAEILGLKPVRDVKDVIRRRPRLGLDYFPGRVIEGNDPAFVPFSMDNDRAFLDEPPSQAKGFCLSKPGIRGQDDQVVKNFLDRGVRILADFPGGLLDLGEVSMRQGPDLRSLPEHLNLPKWILAVVPAPIDCPVVHRSEGLAVSVDRGLRRGPRLLRIGGESILPEPHLELLDMVGGEAG